MNQRPGQRAKSGYATQAWRQSTPFDKGGAGPGKVGIGQVRHEWGRHLTGQCLLLLDTVRPRFNSCDSTL